MNLSSSSQQTLFPNLRMAEEQKRWDHTTLLGQLERIYHDPHKLQKAEDRLFKTKQNDDSIAAFIPKFERASYDAAGQAWSDGT